jgi:hypothetical protein
MPLRVEARVEDAGLNATLVGSMESAETPAHFSVHSADFPQSPFVCLSQCSCWQQSEVATTSVSDQEP